MRALCAPKAFTPMFSVAAAEWIHMCRVRWKKDVVCEERAMTSSSMNSSKSVPAALMHADDDDSSHKDATEENVEWIDDHNVPLAIR